MAEKRAWYPRRSKRLCLARRQRAGGWHDPEVCARRQIRHANRKAGPSKGDNDPSQLGRPADIWIDQGEAYVADGYGNHRVIVFDAQTGANKRHWGAYGKRPIEEEGPPAKPFTYNPAAAPSPSFANPVHCIKVANDGLV